MARRRKKEEVAQSDHLRKLVTEHVMRELEDPDQEVELDAKERAGLVGDVMDDLEEGINSIIAGVVGGRLAMLEADDD